MILNGSICECAVHFNVQKSFSQLARRAGEILGTFWAKWPNQYFQTRSDPVSLVRGGYDILCNQAVQYIVNWS